ncbi:hypothetical protein Acr_13g0009240 [Actinidia rufa]|uniref:Uncharacterized protein n=1 Tax=Actinidia rufa TaxID=165716 RepID=A0A7J0FLF3_9ERIC|nr:hypothetical protein Acr_13g0009240 [Actinidia rufa]
MEERKSRIDTCGVPVVVEGGCRQLLVIVAKLRHRTFGACPDTPTIVSLDRLKLSVCLDALIAVSMSRRLTQLCLYGLVGSWPSYRRRLYPGMGAVKGYLAKQVSSCPLMCLEFVANRCPSTKLQHGDPVELAIVRQVGSDGYLSSDRANIR